VTRKTKEHTEQYTENQWATETESELRCSRKVSSSCSTSDTRSVILFHCISCQCFFRALLCLLYTWYANIFWNLYENTRSRHKSAGGCCHGVVFDLSQQMCLTLFQFINNTNITISFLSILLNCIVYIVSFKSKTVISDCQILR
jgi:hypothetical protein